MKWTITCEQTQMVDALVKYIVEANSKQEAEENFVLDGIVVSTDYSSTPTVMSSSLRSVSPYRKKDEATFMVIVKYHKEKKMLVLEKDLAYKKAYDIAREWKEALEEKYMLGDYDGPKAEKIFIIKQEPNFGEEICLEM